MNMAIAAMGIQRDSPRTCSSPAAPSIAEARSAIATSGSVPTRPCSHTRQCRGHPLDALRHRGHDPRGTPEPPPPERPLELVSTVLLAIATLLTAWSAYQARQWTGEQALNTSKATATRLAENRS